MSDPGSIYKIPLWNLCRQWLSSCSVNIKSMAPPAWGLHHAHTAHHYLQSLWIKWSNVSSKPAGLDLLIRVIICPPYPSYDWLTTECGCIIKSSENLCKVVLNECYCNTIYDKRMKSLGVVPGNTEYLDGYSHIYSVIYSLNTAGNHFPNTDLIMWFIRLKYCHRAHLFLFKCFCSNSFVKRDPHMCRLVCVFHTGIAVYYVTSRLC